MPLVHCVLSWISILPTAAGMRCTSSTASNLQSWKTPIQWRTKSGPNCAPFIYSSLASQPRNSMRRVTNLPAEKWVEDNSLKEVSSRMSVYYSSSWKCVCICRVWRGLFRFFPRQELYRTQQWGHATFVGRGECRQLPHNHFEVWTAVL